MSLFFPSASSRTSRHCRLSKAWKTGHPRRRITPGRRNINEVLTDARWLLLSRLATSQQFRFVSLEQTQRGGSRVRPETRSTPDARPIGAASPAAQRGSHRGCTDSGVWPDPLAMVCDRGCCGTVIGNRGYWLATAWNPVIILANVGVDVLVNAALLLGEAICLASPFVPLSSKQEPWRRCKEIPSGKRLMGPFMPGVHSSNYLNRNEGRKNLSSASTWERP